MNKIKTECKIPIHEKNGNDKVSVDKLTVYSHWNCGVWVVLTVEGVDYTVNGYDLMAAVTKAQNV